MPAEMAQLCYWTHSSCRVYETSSTNLPGTDTLHREIAHPHREERTAAYPQKFGLPQQATALCAGALIYRLVSLNRRYAATLKPIEDVRPLHGGPCMLPKARDPA